MDSPAPQHHAPRLPLQFTIASLLGLTTLVAVLLSLATLSVGWAILGAVFLLPALVATTLTASWWRREGYPLSFLAWWGVFFRVVFACYAIALFAGAATTCGMLIGVWLGGMIEMGLWGTDGAPSTWTFVFGLIAAAICGLATCVFISRVLLQAAAYERCRKLTLLRARAIRPGGPPSQAEEPGNDAG